MQLSLPQARQNLNRKVRCVQLKSVGRFFLISGKSSWARKLAKIVIASSSRARLCCQYY